MNIHLQSKMGNIEIDTGAAVIVYIDDEIGGATATKAFEYGKGYDLLKIATCLKELSDDLIEDAANVVIENAKGGE